MMTALDRQQDSDELLAALEDVEQLTLSLERTKLRNSLYEFVIAAWPLIEPDTPFVPNWHIRTICDELQNITLNPKTTPRKWIFNIPPGTLKSILIDVMWPAWMWTRKAYTRFLCASYGQHLTVRDNLRVLSPWYQSMFPLALVEDQNTKTRYNNDRRGWRIATSVDGVGTGEHPDVIIIDDPLTAAQAESDTERQAVADWFDRTISTRGASRHVIVVVVMQRLHEKDLSGHLLAKDAGWEHVCFPMRYEKAKPATATSKAVLPDKRDPRTEEGELLFPALFSEEKVKELEKDLGPYGAAGQLQQRPAPEGGGKFKRSWFKMLDALPAHLFRTVRGWDTAATEDDGDWTVGAKIAEFDMLGRKPSTDPKTPTGGTFVVIDIARQQATPAQVDSLMLMTAKLDGVTVAQREEREGGASGKTVIDARAKLLRGHDYAGVTVSSSKIARSKNYRAQCEAGNVYLLRAAWNEAYLSELASFPTGENDDQVDASSAAFNALLLEEVEQPVAPTW
jgi:predicted phage terminase large subunit-like protein